MVIPYRAPGGYFLGIWDPPGTHPQHLLRIRLEPVQDCEDLTHSSPSFFARHFAAHHPMHVKRTDARATPGLVGL